MSLECGAGRESATYAPCVEIMVSFMPGQHYPCLFVCVRVYVRLVCVCARVRMYIRVYLCHDARERADILPRKYSRKLASTSWPESLTRAPLSLYKLLAVSAS